MWDGFIYAIVASCGLGSIFVPMRRHPMGDGFFAQVIFVLGSYMVSVVVSFFFKQEFYRFVMLGGALWTMGNSGSVFAMNRVGMAQGMLIWNISSCLLGWATSRFGLFGVDAQLPSSILLNYVGVGVLIFGASFYLFIKSKPAPNEKKSEEEAIHHKVSKTQRLIGIGVCLVNGLFFGSFYTPISYLQSLPDDKYPKESLPYVFPFFTGVLIMAFIIFIIYSLVKRGKPDLNPQIVLPAFCGGVIFGTSIIFFMLANQKLSPTIAYPITQMFPGLIVSLWSVLYFREITGIRNLALLSVAYTLTLIGVALLTASRSVSL